MSDEEPEQTVENLRSMVTMFDVLEMLGIEVNSQGKITSPYNEFDRTPSCQVYEDHFHCFSTGRSGDIIDIVQAFNPELSWKQAFWKLWTGARRGGFELGAVVREAAPKELPDFSLEYGSTRWTHARRPFTIDGVDLDRLEGHVLGGSVIGWDKSGMMLIPHRWDGKIHGVKVRAGNGKKTAWPGSQFSAHLYWPSSYQPVSKCVVLCEGESDSWAMDQALQLQIDVCALPSGASCWKDHWLEELAPYSTVYVCMDNDDAGRRARDTIFKSVAQAKLLEVPQLFDDARAAIAAGWKPAL